MIEFILSINLMWADPETGQLRSSPFSGRYGSHVECTRALTEAVADFRARERVTAIPVGVKLCEAVEDQGVPRESKPKTQSEPTAIDSRVERVAAAAAAAASKAAEAANLDFMKNHRKLSNAQIAEIQKLRALATKSRAQAAAADARAIAIELGL